MCCCPDNYPICIFATHEPNGWRHGECIYLILHSSGDPSSGGGGQELRISMFKKQNLSSFFVRVNVVGGRLRISRLFRHQITALSGSAFRAHTHRTNDEGNSGEILPPRSGQGCADSAPPNGFHYLFIYPPKGSSHFSPSSSTLRCGCDDVN